jgi:hypothetical protein
MAIEETPARPQILQFNSVRGAPDDGSLPDGFRGMREHRLSISGIGMDVTTSGVAGTRLPRLRIIDPAGRILFSWASGTSMAANLTRRYQWARGVSPATPLAGSTVRESLPDGLYLDPGWKLELTVDLAQTGDTIPLAVVWAVLKPYDQF